MKRHILIYGLLGGALVTGLKWAEYRFLIIDHSFEIYGGLIAATFALFGIWLGIKLTRPPQPIPATPIPAAPTQTFLPDEARRESLGITRREFEILELVAEGLSNREIAEKLFVSENTVKTHCSRAFEKLGAKRRTQAVQLCKEFGLLPEPHSITLSMKKIILLGGSGQIGNTLASYFHAKGDSVVAVSRKPTPSAWATDTWDAKSLGPWTKHLEGATAVINLSGSTINTRFTEENRKLILGSRLESTHLTASAIRTCARPPALWINASAVDIYPHTFTPCVEDSIHSRLETGAVDTTTPDSWRFISEVVYQWEKAVIEEEVFCRKVALRTTIMLSPDAGGIFRLLLQLTKLGLGGAQGSGQQYMSWMHHTDYARAVDFLIEHTEIAGPVNITSPNPLPNNEFMKVLRHAAGMPIGLPAPAFGLKIVSAILRTEPVLILKSRRSIPQVLQQAGFTWLYPEWSQSADDLVSHSK